MFTNSSFKRSTGLVEQPQQNLIDIIEEDLQLVVPTSSPIVTPPNSVNNLQVQVSSLSLSSSFPSSSGPSAAAGNRIMDQTSILGNNSVSIRQPTTSNTDSDGNKITITQPPSTPISPRPASVASIAYSPSQSPTPHTRESSTSSSEKYNCSKNCKTQHIHNLSLKVEEKPLTTEDLDWQASKNDIRSRNALMCGNELMSDVHFIVGRDLTDQVKKFPAHKYVLATGSSVFYAMFFGTLAEQTDTIEVPDVEPEAFDKMLKYLYSDEIILDEECVLPTLNVAKKYIIPYLAKACVEYLEASLTARNACVLLGQSRIFDEMDLMQRSWEVIDAQAEMALNSEGFLEIDHVTFLSILERETLNCQEITVFNASMKWATAECERTEIPSSPENLRRVLGKALNLIRIPTIDIKEFADSICSTGLLTLKETHDLFLYFTATNKPQVSYPVAKRAGLKPYVCHRFNSSAYRSNQWRYRGRTDSILFQVDRRIFIVGFGLYGSSGGSSTYVVHIELKKQGKILAENDCTFYSDGSSNTFPVYFRQPIQIEPDIFYTSSAILEGLELSYFGQEGMTDVCVENVTFQFQCSAESSNGTGVQGGQIPELIFYGPTPITSTVTVS